MTHPLLRAALAAVLIAGFASASAAPVRYDFTTDTINSMATHPALQSLLAGPVTGSFVYDAATPLTTQFSAPAIGFGPAPSAIYSGALLRVEGNVNGRAFADATGENAVVANDSFNVAAFPSPVAADLFLLVSDPFTFGNGAPRQLVGFAVGDFVLVNVRLFWLEVGVPGTPDFLTSLDLPSAPPSFGGRLALDFVPRAVANNQTPFTPISMFFDGLRATTAAVPAPVAGPLFAVLALGLVLQRRRA